jgi:uncharacterized protein (DUF1330 family)
MASYIIARARIDDPEKAKAYAAQATEAIRKHGGKPLARGGAFTVLEGPDHGFTRYVILEFESLEKAKAYFASPEYQAAAAIRRDGAGVWEIVAVEGV